MTLDDIRALGKWLAQHDACPPPDESGVMMRSYSIGPTKLDWMSLEQYLGRTPTAAEMNAFMDGFECQVWS